MSLITALILMLLGLQTVSAQQNPPRDECDTGALQTQIRERIERYLEETADVMAWQHVSDSLESLLIYLPAALNDCGLMPSERPTPDPARTIAIVSGHSGATYQEGDVGAVCEDGLTEAEINFDVAVNVVRALREYGYTVLLLDEFDPRLDRLQAAALVSIHTNTCRDFGETVSGFLVDKVISKEEGGADSQLAACIAEHYAAASGLYLRPGATVHMTDYHRFNEIAPQTPAATIELGFMFDDRDILTNRQDTLARGLVEGIMCFINPALLPEATPETMP